MRGLRVALLGKPGSAKASMSVILSAMYGCDRIKAADIITGDAREEIQNLRAKIAETDIERGFILEGFPMTKAQADEMERQGLEIDLVLQLERTDAEARSFMEGRQLDPVSGLAFHPELRPCPLPDSEAKRLQPHPPPADIDTSLKGYNKQLTAIRRHFSDVLSVLETPLSTSLAQSAADAALLLDSICIVDFEGGGEVAVEQRVWQTRGDSEEEDQPARPHGSLYNHVKALNTYNTLDFLPFMVGKQRAGWARESFARILQQVQEEEKLDLFAFDWPGIGDGGSISLGNIGLNGKLLDSTVETRSDIVHQMMETLFEKGHIRGWRGEMQVVSAGFNQDPLLLLERGAVPYFGVAAYGTHINVLSVGEDGTKYVWIAKRAMDKPTYPGLLDQCVAGGQPQGLSLQENVVKECVEEADIPEEVAETAVPVGAVRYMYETRKGLSPKTLFCYDLVVPASFEPVNTDGEVESFRRMTLADAVDAVAKDPKAWKPNSALVMIHLAIRHGILNPDNEPDYLDIVSLLHTAPV